MKKEKNSPVIVTRQEHGISRKLMNPNALRILYRLKDNGFAGYLVGGCVRDLLLGREPKDFDVVTNATPNEVKRMFRNCRLIGRRFRLAHLHYGDEIIEVATFRSQAADEPEPEQAPETKPQAAHRAEHRQRHPRSLKDDDGMVLRDNVFGTPEEDALRRDFTVNALLYNIVDFSIIDYTNGLADLNAGIIRTIGDPEVRFQEDPVRMLRAVRFAALLGFTHREADPCGAGRRRRHHRQGGTGASLRRDAQAVLLRRSGHVLRPAPADRALCGAVPAFLRLARCRKRWFSPYPLRADARLRRFPHPAGGQGLPAAAPGPAVRRVHRREDGAIPPTGPALAAEL